VLRVAKNVINGGKIFWNCSNYKIKSMDFFFFTKFILLEIEVVVGNNFDCFLDYFKRKVEVKILNWKVNVNFLCYMVGLMKTIYLEKSHIQ